MANALNQLHTTSIKLQLEVDKAKTCTKSAQKVDALIPVLEQQKKTFWKLMK